MKPLGRQANSRATLTSAIAIAVVVGALGSQIAGPRSVSEFSVPSSLTTATEVAFSVSAAANSSVNLSLGFNSIFSMSGGPIAAGRSVNATAALLSYTGATLNLTVSFLGQNSSTSFPIANPLGRLVAVPVPGLSLSYLGVGLGVYLNVSGVVDGNSTVFGPATGGGGTLEWNSTGIWSFDINASPAAPSGAKINSSLENISYGLSFGLDLGAQIPGLGYYSYTLVQFGSLGLFAGSPDSANATYAVPTKGGDSGGGSALPGFFGTAEGGFVILGVIGAACVSAVSILVVLRRRR